MWGGVVAAQRYAPHAQLPLLIAGVAIDAWDTAAFARTANLPAQTRTARIAVAGTFTVIGVAAAISATSGAAGR